MDAGNLWMLREFIGTNKVLFQIPVYQRNYDWSEMNCNRLLDDIKNIIDTGEKHFLGSIVFMSTKEHGFSLQTYTVIDGQQRLTTMMILLKALSDVAAENGEVDCVDEIQHDYLHNKHCAEEYKVKLKPIKSDNDQFIALLNDKEDELDPEGHIALNYGICRKRIEKWVQSGISAGTILEALERLEMVYISLKKGEDDPQVIFESINSTGLELSSADLIRNFLLMNAPDQERLYEEYWLYIEKTLKKNTDYANLNMFFMQYLAYKTNAPINADRIYTQFVQLFKSNGYTQETCLKELKYYADIFRAFVYDDSKYPDHIRKTLKSLRQLKQTTCYPFLLHVFDDYEQGVIDAGTLDKVLKFTLSYLLRRAVCGIPSNTLRGMFIYLYSRVFKVASNKRKYYESINKFFHTVATRDAVPSDDEFWRSLNQANMYSNSALCKFLLADIENGDRKETLIVDTLTIEHIMPQTLSVEWRYISEKDHEDYLHVLGNLSVTGYNSELSNKSFAEKRKVIKDNSKAVILNKDVWDKETWTIEDIKKRGERLAAIVMKRYPIEKIVDNSIEFEYLTKITLDDYDAVTGKKLVNFCFEGETFHQNRYVFMLLDVIKLLDQKMPGKLEKLASHDYSFSTAKNKHPLLSTMSDGMYWPWDLKDGIYLESNLSARKIMHLIDNLLKEYGVDQSAFSISVVSEGYDGEDADE